MKIISLITCLLFLRIISFSQNTDLPDSIKKGTLPEVIIKAYEQNRRLKDIGAAINYINKTALEKYDNLSFLPAINATAGAKMEERSPGSYRLNIRGSSLRAPFGVRNVKVYYDGIPLTDPGGTTYFNHLSVYNINSIEILKGPAGSIYGAGTGGVLLLQSTVLSGRRVAAHCSAGSYGLLDVGTTIFSGNDSFQIITGFQHQASNGYRRQSALKRDVASGKIIWKPTRKDMLTATFFYGNLFYQTPGGLTLQEYLQKPDAARPSVGTTPGAEAAHAAIYQKTFLGGISYQKLISSNWTNNTSIYGAVTNLDNPAIRNYAINKQPHYGGRTIFTYNKKYGFGDMQWITGAEIQHGFTSSKVYKNLHGSADSLMSSDEIRVNIRFFFNQLSITYKNWIATVGASFNQSGYKFSRINSIPGINYNLSFNNQLAPRISLLRKIDKDVSVYAVWSKGFSPPAIDEVFPSGSFANPQLSAEQGTNYETGLKGDALSKRLSFDVSIFYFKLSNTIVQRRDAAGGDFYINAGNTSQKGMEVQMNYKLLQNKKNAISVWGNYSFYNFRYVNFIQVNNDFSNKMMPGVGKHFLNVGADVSLKNLNINTAYQYNSGIPLNDANSAYANSYNILTSKISYNIVFNKISLNGFFGCNNILNIHYSLGNDLNAFGGRYYNAAPLRNFYTGIILGYGR